MFVHVAPSAGCTLNVLTKAGYQIPPTAACLSQLTAWVVAAAKLATGRAVVCICAQQLPELMPVCISFSALVKQVWINSQHSARYSCLAVCPGFTSPRKAISIYVPFLFLMMESFSCDIAEYFKATSLPAFLPLFFFSSSNPVLVWRLLHLAIVSKNPKGFDSWCCPQ